MSDSRLYSSKYLRRVFAAPKLVIGLALFFFVCGGLIVWCLPNFYQSEARVNLNTRGMFDGMMQDIDQPRSNLTDPAQVVVELVRDRLFTTANLEKVAIETGLLVDVCNYDDKEKLLKDLKANISLISQPRLGTRHGMDKLVLSYRDIRADQSLDILSSFFGLLLGDVFGDGTRDNGRTLAFLDEHIEITGALLSTAEFELNRFKTENASFESVRSGSEPGEAVYAVSKIEDEFRTLSRDYNSYHEMHLDFLKRRQRAAVGVPNESVPLFRVVEAPRILPDVDEPNRPLLFTFVFIGACALGIAAPIFRDLIGTSVFVVYGSKYLRRVCAAPRLVIGMALFFCGCGCLVVWYLPSVYKSEARLNVNTRASAQLMLYAPYGEDQTYRKRAFTGDEIANLARDRLVTQPNLEKVAVENDLLLEARSDSDKKPILEDLAASVSLVSQHRQVTGKGMQDIVISYRDIDADRSLYVLSGLLELLLGDVLDRSARDLARAQSFLSNRGEFYGGALKDTEIELTRLRTEHVNNKSGQSKSNSGESSSGKLNSEDWIRVLERNLNTYRERYLDFQRRRENLSFLIDDKPAPVFQVVEAPRTLTSTVEPNRPLLLVLVLVGACALGITAPAFRDLVRSSDS